MRKPFLPVLKWNWNLEILEQIVHKIPAPTGDLEAPLQALIFDSVYDAYRVVLNVRIQNGIVRPGTRFN